MTVQHDLSLVPEARTQRRLSNLEQGFIANQSAGAWSKNIIAGESANFGETLNYVNGLLYTIPTYGQYHITASLDQENRGGGFAYTQLQVNGFGIFNAFLAPTSYRAGVSHTWGGWIERGQTVGIKLAIASPAAGASVWVFSGVLTITKIA